MMKKLVLESRAITAYTTNDKLKYTSPLKVSKCSEWVKVSLTYYENVRKSTFSKKKGARF